MQKTVLAKKASFLFGVPVDMTLETGRVNRLYPLPLSPYGIEGTILLHQQSFYLMDLHALINQSSVQSGKFFIAVKSKNLSMAFSADSLEGIKNLNVSSERTPHPLIKKVLNFVDQEIPLVDIEKIVEHCLSPLPEEKLSV